MNNEEIQILEKYLSQDEIKEICISWFRKTLSSENNAERILSNALSADIQKEVNHVLGGDGKFKDWIEAKVNKTLTEKEDLSYYIFKKKDAWEREEGLGTVYLNEAVRNNKDLLNEKVKDAIDKLKPSDIKRETNVALKEIMKEKLSL